MHGTGENRQKGESVMATIFPREEKAEQLFEKILENPDACERLKDTFYEHFPESEDMDAQMPEVSSQTFTRALFCMIHRKHIPQHQLFLALQMMRFQLTNPSPTTTWETR